MLGVEIARRMMMRVSLLLVVVMRSRKLTPPPLVVFLSSAEKSDAASSGTGVGVMVVHSGACHCCLPSPRMIVSMDRSAAARMVAEGLTPVEEGKRGPVHDEQAGVSVDFSEIVDDTGGGAFACGYASEGVDGGGLSED